MSFTTNSSGMATVQVLIAALKAPQNAGGPVGFQLAGATLESIQDNPISTAPGKGLPDLTYVRSARGADSTYTQIVTDGLLHMRVACGLTGDVYGVQVKRTGWAFNNLTYKESARSLWKTNPLGRAGNDAINGRTWRTECDTPATGGNGCRGFITTTVVESTRSGSGYTYTLVRKEVFNNIVLFESAR